MKTVILSDSTAYIPQSLRESYNIHTIPLSVVFDQEAFKEEVDLSTEAFYEKVKESEALPTTSQPSVGDFVEIFEKLAESYDSIIFIHISSKLSGTGQAAETAKTLVENVDIRIFDSKYSAIPQGFFALEAAKLAQDEVSPDAIMEHLEQVRDKIRAYFMVDDLSHLQRGGRISNAQAVLGSLLKVKPILHIEEGYIVPYEKIRTRKKALNKIFSMLEADITEGKVEQVCFIHANDEQAANDLEKQFKEKFPHIDTLVSYFGPVVGTHLGEGSIGVAWLLK